MKRRKENVAMVAPDGGWGWFIVLGSCLINFSTRAIEPSFGLLFKDLFKQLGVETAGASLVISILDGTASCTGLIVGPLMKKYTCRNIAILGGVMSASAILLTATANSMLHIVITFGVLGGIGFGLVTSCTLIAINDYFLKKKGQAVGLSMTGTAVGYMIMPQIVRYFLDEYDFRSTMFIIGALSLHVLVGACLFQPVSWHKKAVMVKVEEEALTLLSLKKAEIKDSLASTEPTSELSNNMSTTHFDDGNNLFYIQSEFSKKESSNFPFSDYRNKIDIKCQENAEEESHNKTEKMNAHGEENPLKNNQKSKPRKRIRQSVKNHMSRFSKYMGLDLLRDGVYLNINYGLSMCIVNDVNLKMIVPFFLSDLGFTRSEIAFALSSMGVADICARLVVPPIADRITCPRRVTFLFGLICLSFAQSSLALLTTIGPIIATSVIMGFFHGITLTALPVVLTEYSSGNNFPSVLGLSMVCKAIFIAVFGPLSGYIRDITDSYPLFIHFQTVLMVSVLISWTFEIVIIKLKNR